MSVLMKKISTEVFQNYTKFESDDEVEKWFLMSSPIPIITIIATYLITVKWLGPKYMENRKPYKLQKILLFYNAFVVMLALYFDYVAITDYRRILLMIFQPNTFYPTVDKTGQLKFCKMVWLYFITKVIELADTVLFVLRKKSNQVTFLHVYHHSVMAMFAWAVAKFSPESQCLGGLLNTNVHVIMYSYYFISALGPDFQKYIWWKKYLTKLQLGQFIIVLVYTLLQPVTPRNKFITVFNFCNVIFFVLLFSNFYIKTYKNKINQKKGQ